ncbi:hypothetical protein HYALB_00002913 [Hymenoscyphus albidus]|uniref:Uncharacterized protein n=1 Tax=Hymenoscyphus albidus TaxID=595503 RepID=A0A9N9M4F7_9HELO|nr:hypothetical protein HYALB_00002913 [Hymenoscyphus albidus]
MSYLRERNGNGQAQGTELRHWLSVCRHSLSTNPRDKVFALLGLATDYDIKKIISIDYSKSITKVYREVIDLYVPSCGNSTDDLFDKIGWMSLFETLQQMLGQELELETAAMAPFEDPEPQRTLWCAAENIGTITNIPIHSPTVVRTSNRGTVPQPSVVANHTLIQNNADPHRFSLSISKSVEPTTTSDDNFIPRNTLRTRYFEISRDGSIVNTGFAPSSAKTGDCIIGFPGSRVGLFLRDRKMIIGRVLMHRWNTNDEFCMRHWADILPSKQETGPLFDVFPESGLTEKFYLKLTRAMLHKLTAK